MMTGMPHTLGARLVLSTLIIGTAAACLSGTASPRGTDRVIPSPAVDTQPGTRSSEVAILAGGCFWGVQGVYQHVKGVTSAVSGYAGDDERMADYDKVSSGRTRHAESVRIVFDPRVISYGRLLQIFFAVAHDPTELNRQGPDEGPQYRSTVFPTSAEQAHVVKAYVQQLNDAKVFGAPIVTTIEEGREFYRAEAYHQDFLERNPSHPYIVVNDLPKIAALKQAFPDFYRTKPVLVRSFD
jgi:peptide-methionine (S)-S-oxide reductase